MKTKIHLSGLLFLLATFLSSGCSGLHLISKGQIWIGAMAISSYRVVDATGANRMPVIDLIVDDRSGNVDYIVIRTPFSGFDLDIRTAPFHSDQILLIPRQLSALEPETMEIKLQVGMQALNNSPRFSLPINSLPDDWRNVVDQYWFPIMEEKQ
jgi:hypothetical protein